jgi:hypothetical protein
MNFPGQRRSEQLVMFSITAKTSRAFTLAEILIMAAMNVETIRLASANRAQPHRASAQKK